MNHHAVAYINAAVGDAVIALNAFAQRSLKKDDVAGAGFILPNRGQRAV